MELSCLGASLRDRAEDVVSALRARTLDAGVPVVDSVDEVFERAARVSTVAVARWIGGESADAAREAGWAATRGFAELAANRAASLDEVTKRCLRWRDATLEVLAEETARRGLGDGSAGAAVAMLGRSFDVTLVRMCAAYEAERARMHETLLSREAELSFLATHDALTGLANRALLLRSVEAWLSRRRRVRDLAVLYVDVDRFKLVNDEHGHAAGDAVLKAVAERLGQVTRLGDTVGRIGGDEFVAVIEAAELPADPQRVAERLVAVAREPITVGSGLPDVLVTVSVGVAYEPRPTADGLLRDADAAMYVAKRAGGDGYRVAARCVGG